MRRVLPGTLIVLLLAGACTKQESPTSPTPPTSAAVSPTTVAFTSDPSSSVGRGESPTYTVENATFQVGTDSRFISVAVLPRGATDVLWRFVLHPPTGQVLAPGTFSINNNAGHAFEFSSRGDRCGGAGTMTIEDLHNTGGLVDVLRVNFSLSCGGTVPVNGRIVLNWVPGTGYR